ncbi:MAG: glucose-6-phosphate dehydrogenase, partial [Planktomarina sp.]
MVTRVIPVEVFDLVIFGGTGDLARRKILPGLFRRFCAGQMPRESRIIGAARSDLDQAGYQDMVRDAIAEFGSERTKDCPDLKAFLAQLDYVKIDARGDDGWAQLSGMVRPDVVHAYYFSVGPGLFGDIAERLRQYGLADDKSRIVVEKPFGKNLDSARSLNQTLAAY